MIFYLLGVFAFHAPGTIHILPFVAVGALIIDYLFARRFRKS